MPSKEANAAVRRGWRQLGFFYDRDDETKRWRILGSLSGVKKFCDLLRRYAADTRNIGVSEHEHYGPYSYLEVMTWTEPQLDEHALAGRIEDLRRLADLVEAKVAAMPTGGRFAIGAEYAPKSQYVLEISLMGDGFDPASVDPHCQEASNP